MEVGFCCGVPLTLNLQNNVVENYNSNYVERNSIKLFAIGNIVKMFKYLLRDKNRTFYYEVKIYLINILLEIPFQFIGLDHLIKFSVNHNQFVNFLN